MRFGNASLVVDEDGIVSEGGGEGKGGRVHRISSACGRSFVCFVFDPASRHSPKKKKPQNFYHKRMKDGVGRRDMHAAVHSTGLARRIN